ncbi:MAG: hypothetical protein L0Y58_12245 [Verrucomicrobia subdivision 3 bacterium]|nr:hypothetical protein [Limisphaerales bacterium]
MQNESAHQRKTTDTAPPHVYLRRLMLVLGIILCLGSLGHAFGVARFYIAQGIPDANRVLLDVWIAEAQLLGGALYLVAYRALRSGRPWRTAAGCGALTVCSYAGPFIPVLFVRAPIAFRIPPVIHLLLSVLILIHAASRPRTNRA